MLMVHTTKKHRSAFADSTLEMHGMLAVQNCLSRQIRSCRIGGNHSKQTQTAFHKEELAHRLHSLTFAKLLSSFALLLGQQTRQHKLNNMSSTIESKTGSQSVT